MVLGSGYHTYELDEKWGKLPAGMEYGFGCGVIVDKQRPHLCDVPLDESVRGDF